jgi:hypothetical protein
MANSTGRPPLGEIVRLFLRLGLTAFGGPAAHLGLMQREAVERRGWMSRERFLDLVGACNLLPGPGSTQVAMALGYSRGGWIGLIVAGCCFILPASLATLALAWAYVRYSSLPQAQGLLYGPNRSWSPSSSRRFGTWAGWPFAAGRWRWREWFALPRRWPARRRLRFCSALEHWCWWLPGRVPGKPSA